MVVINAISELFLKIIMKKNNSILKRWSGQGERNFKYSELTLIFSNCFAPFFLLCVLHLKKVNSIKNYFLVFFYYIGSGSIRWFLGRKGPPVLQPLPSCLASKLLRYQDILDSYNGHRSGEDFISFVGNGNIGLRNHN